MLRAALVLGFEQRSKLLFQLGVPAILRSRTAKSATKTRSVAAEAASDARPAKKAEAQEGAAATSGKVVKSTTRATASV